MGGNAFPNHPCPRLSHAKYDKLRDRTLGLLKDRFYAKVVCPPEAPSKVDHGDIDLLVADPIVQFTADDISKALQAVQHTRTGKTTSFAVPLTVGTEDYCGNVDPRFEGQYVQIDIHVCKSEDIEWEIFHNSYGDLMQILGVMNRSIGLTANDRGLHLRLQDIEVYNKKKSLIYLTKDPREMMDFLGLDHERYFNRGFNSNEEIYDWCAGGRLYTSPSHTRASDGGNETANDRQRYKKRPMFTICMNEYYPAHPELFADRQVYTREDVVQEALKHFPDAQSSYDAALSEHKQAMWEKSILASIKDTIPATNEKLGEVIRGLKRFVRYDTDGMPRLAEDHKEEITERPNWIENVDSEARLDELLIFVGENWEAVRALERQRTSDMKTGRVKRDSHRPSGDSEKEDGTSSGERLEHGEEIPKSEELERHNQERNSSQQSNRGDTKYHHGTTEDLHTEYRLAANHDQQPNEGIATVDGSKEEQVRKLPQAQR
ncbi:hypothetical protein FKW77_010300 [Venturia effusa]|uniref:Uncharacterized protein n=1 Tax=Venturia effusa TaxID=50376 RepID=A0A517L0I1_9PEZI|nr:hypothetical protein FKW77_010300 [Venturia effusa]